MKLNIYLPNEILLRKDVRKVVAESPAGSFALLPRHIDMATALVPGLLSYVDERGTEVFLAVAEGIMVKNGTEVMVSVRSAVQGELGELESAVNELSQEGGEKEKAARSAMAKLEANFVRRFLEFEK